MKILGISAYYHDSAACLLEGTSIIAAAQEERFTRLKHDATFPTHAIKYCLQEACIDLSDVDAIVFYDKPFLKFERLLETYYRTAPKGLFSFVKAIPIWLKEKLFLKMTIKKALSEIGEINFSKSKLLFSEHHLSHAASAFFTSNFASSAILTIDGVGEWATASIAQGEENAITIKQEMHFPDSLGLLYSAFTYFLGFKVNSGEYKLMGLAPYGDPDNKNTLKYIQSIKEELVQIFEDGSMVINQEYFQYTWGLKMINVKKWESLFGIKMRVSEGELKREHFNLAFAIQAVTEELVVLMAKQARKITGSDSLCLSGGVALNCVANGRLIQEDIFKHIYIQPASGDAGGALGGALAVAYMHFGLPREVSSDLDQMQGAYLGPAFSGLQIKRALEKFEAVYTKYNSENEFLEFLVQRLEKGDAIGFFQGRMEFGPRALGNRSILADPRNPDAQKKLNLKIKQRESFRPFAPILLEEELQEYFEIAKPSPYMLVVDWFKEDQRFALPKDYYTKDLSEMLYFPRTSLPAITHIVFSSRLQTVTKDSNDLLHKLLASFKQKTGVGMLVNTSFNLRGEPIVCSPQDALKTFFSCEMDVLCLGKFVLLKKEQKENVKIEVLKRIAD